MSEATKQQAYQLFQQGRLDEAQRIARALLSQYPDDTQLWLLNGLIYARKNQFAEAETSLKAALQFERNYQTLLSLGQVHLVAGHLSKAEACLAEATNYDYQPGPNDARVILANLYANEGKYRRHWKSISGW